MNVVIGSEKEQKIPHGRRKNAKEKVEGKVLSSDKAPSLRRK